jgi:catechol-2,3-dioxygenase
MTNSEPRLVKLRSVDIRTTALAESVDFYTNVWGLRTVEKDTDAAWLRGTGTEHHCVSFHAAERNGLDRISFAVESPADVDAWAWRLEANKVPLISTPGRTQRPGGGYSLELVDPEGRVIEIAAEWEAVVPLSSNVPEPVGITHIVLNTANIDAAVAFYCTVLGMKVSDWSEHRMAFLRCNSYHHAIAFNQAEWASINHVAYEMPTVDQMMQGLGRLQHFGIVPLWGPGRHGPGNNAFSYFADPARLVCEYTSDVQQILESDWLPRVWPRTPELADLWGTAGPPSSEIRCAMTGYQDPGAFEQYPDLQDQYVARQA